MKPQRPSKGHNPPAYASHLKPLARELRKRATFPERLLWSRLRRRQLGVRFLRQRPIDQYIVDFWCPAYQLIIEIDGHSHRDSGEADEPRQANLESLGLSVLRFSNDAVLRDVDSVVREIAAWIEQANDNGRLR